MHVCCPYLLLLLAQEGGFKSRNDEKENHIGDVEHNPWAM